MFRFITDVSWQTALAHSAVSAAEDVRSTVRAARTASNAKFAAVNAAHMAKSVCEKGRFTNMNEARAAQTRASITQSHAIHAAVVEHEAKTVKRRATLALAHDVKCWNVHRKREALKICLDYSKSQHEATRRAVDAWSCLRDGFVGSTIIPSTQYWKSAKSEPIIVNDESEMKATIFGNVGHAGEERQSIVAVEHRDLQSPAESFPLKAAARTDNIDSSTKEELDLNVSLLFATPIPEEVEETSNSGDKENFALDNTQLIPLQSAEVNSETDHEEIEDDYIAQSPLILPPSTSSEIEMGDESTFEKENDETLTSSMQSLVDGLMNWGDFDVEDNIALPTGMAASIALEESIAFGNSP